MKIVFVLDNIRSAFNVGAIFRISEALSYDIHLIGITPTPLNKKTKIKLEKTSLKTIDHVNWLYFKNVDDWFKSINISNKKDYLIISVENIKDSQKSMSLFDISSLTSEFKNKKYIYICLGHEINGVSNFLITKSDFIIYLPMQGTKNSLNVSSCAGIVGYFLKIIG